MKAIPVVLILMLIGCGSNHNPPTYMKSGYLYKAGDDAVKVDFTLADKNDVPTACNGTATLIFYQQYMDIYQQNYSDVVKWRTIHMVKLNVKIDDFVGEKNLLHFESQRILYSSFRVHPKENTDGKVEVTFRDENGQTFTGSYVGSW